MALKFRVGIKNDCGCAACRGVADPGGSTAGVHIDHAAVATEVAPPPTVTDRLKAAKSLDSDALAAREKARQSPIAEAPAGTLRAAKTLGEVAPPPSLTTAIKAARAQKEQE